MSCDDDISFAAPCEHASVVFVYGLNVSGAVCLKMCSLEEFVYYSSNNVLEHPSEIPSSKY